MDKELKAGIAAVRFPMALLVVMIHCKLEPINDWILWVNHLFGGGISHIAVPVFFFLSGYLFLRGCDSWKKYGTKLKRRLRTVVVPYIIFNLIAIGVHCVKGRTLIDVGEFWTMMVVKPQDFPLWYLKALMILFLTVPPLMMLKLKAVDYALVLVSMLAYLCYGQAQDTGYLIGYTFFSLGAFCCRYFSRLQIKTMASVVLLVLSIVALWWHYHCGVWDTVKFFNLPATLLVVFNLRFFASFKYLPKLSKYSSFIYYAHTILVGGLVVSVANRWCCNAVTALLLPFVVSAILIVVYEIMNRLCPRLFGVMIGR